MMRLATSLLAALALSLVLVPVCRRAARRYGYVAKPRADRWHAQPTALLGGVAIVCTVLILHPVLSGLGGAPVLLAGAALMFLIGLVDDIVSLNPQTKLALEIAVASIFVFFGYRLSWTSSLTLDTLLTVVWIVGFTNAFNLLDNMDGLCAGIGLIAGGSLLVSLLANGTSGPDAIYLALLMGAMAGFLVFNVHPASIFMGDSGSLFIGLSLSVLTLGGAGSSPASSSLLSVMVAPCLILLVPLLDTTLVTASRILSGRSAAQGGRDHTSHRLVAIGLSERSAVVVLWMLSGLGGLLAVSVRHYKGDWPSIAAAVFVLAMILFAVYLAQVRVYGHLDRGLAEKGRITPIVVDIVYRRRLAEVLLDACLIAIAYYSAYRLRFDEGAFAVYFPRFLESLPLVLGVQIVSLMVAGAYQGVWRYFGLMDVVTLAKGIGLGSLLNVSLLVYAYRFQEYSRGVFAIDAVLLMLLLPGSRASFRLIAEFARRRRQSGRRVVILGTGDVGAAVVRELLDRDADGYRLLGFIDEDPRMRRVRMHGYPVLGDHAVLAKLVVNREVDLVVIALPMDGERIEATRALCAAHQVALEQLHYALRPLVVPMP